jgi:hypothetical protein
MMATDAPAQQSSPKSVKNGTPYVSSKDQKASTPPASEPSLGDIVQNAFKPRPSTIPSETKPTILNRDTRAEEPEAEANPAAKESNEEKSKKPDPRVTRKDELKKSVTDVWSKLPAANELEKETDKPAKSEKETPALEAEASDSDPFANAKENDWKAAKAAAKQRQEELTKKIQDLEAKEKKAAEELNKYREVTADPSEVNRLKEEHRKALDRLALLDYQSHPEYRKNFVEPREQLKAQVIQILADNGVEGVDIDGMLSKPRGEYAKAMSELEDRLNSYDAGEIRATMRDLQKVTEASKQAVGKYGEMAQALKQQSEIKSRQAFEEVVKENKSWMLKPYEIPESLDPEEKQSLEEFNKAVSQIKTQAERYAFSPSDEKTSAALAFKAAQYDLYTNHAIPRMVKDYQDAKATIAELTDKLKQLQAKRPGIVDSATAPSSNSQQTEKPSSLKEMVRQTYRRQ